MTPPFRWVPYEGGDSPENMVQGGKRCNDDPLYVCRGKVNGVDVAGKFDPNQKRAYFPYDYNEVKQTTCEILCSDTPEALTWVPASKGAINDAAVFVGYDVLGILYVGRGNQSNELIPGKIYPPHKVCYVSTQRKEWPLQDYEVLVYTSE